MRLRQDYFFKIIQETRNEEGRRALIEWLPAASKHLSRRGGRGFWHCRVLNISIYIRKRHSTQTNKFAACRFFQVHNTYSHRASCEESLSYGLETQKAPAIKCEMCKTSSQLNPENNATISSCLWLFYLSCRSFFFNRFYSSTNLWYFTFTHCLVYKTLNFFSSLFCFSSPKRLFFLLHNSPMEPSGRPTDSWELQHLKASKTHF